MSQRFGLGEQNIEISQPDASARDRPSLTFRVGIGIRFFVALVIVSTASNCRSSDAYCGVHCVFACADILDRNRIHPFEDLLTVEFVDSNKGSSATALVKALDLFHLNGSVMTNMGLFDLNSIRRQWVSAIAIFFGLSATTGIAVDLCRNRLMLDRDASGSLVASHQATNFETIDLAALQKAIITQTVLIDSRRGSDFELGTIPGALSLPVDCSPTEFEKFVARIPQNKPLVVFCQSETCPYADAIARRLALHGFREIRIFRGGYIAWHKHSALKESPVHE